MATKTQKQRLVTRLEDAALGVQINRVLVARIGRRSFEADDRAETAKLAEMMSCYREEMPDVSIFLVGEVAVSPIAGKNSRVSAEKLLSRGVDPEIIRDCTETTTFTRWDIKEHSGDDGRDH